MRVQAGCSWWLRPQEATADLHFILPWCVAEEAFLGVGLDANEGPFLIRKLIVVRCTKAAIAMDRRAFPPCRLALPT